MTDYIVMIADMSLIEHVLLLRCVTSQVATVVSIIIVVERFHVKGYVQIKVKRTSRL